MASVPGNDPDVLRLQEAAKTLSSRGLTDQRIVNYVTNALRDPSATDGLALPEKFTPTHQTGGLDGFPAVDLFAPPGTPVYPPEDCELVWPHKIEWRKNAAVGGWTCYLQGDSGNTYFATHFGMVKAAGSYTRRDQIGTVGKVPGTPQWWPPHIHFGKHRGRYTP